MKPLPLDYARCSPEAPDNYCKNCKRWAAHPKQTWGERTPNVATTDSRDEACIYIPISLMEKNK